MLRKMTRGSVSPAHLKIHAPQKTETHTRTCKGRGKRIRVSKETSEIGRRVVVPNAEIGSAIVDDNGGVGGEETVIGLPLYSRYERHSLLLRLGELPGTQAAAAAASVRLKHC